MNNQIRQQRATKSDSAIILSVFGNDLYFGDMFGTHASSRNLVCANHVFEMFCRYTVIPFFHSIENLMLRVGE